MIICKKCNIEKPDSEFYKAKETKTGFRTDCKDCCKAWHKANRKANVEKYKAKNLAYYEANKEDHQANSRKYREKNKDKLREYFRKHYDKNKVAHSKRMKIYYEANKEKAFGYSRKRKALKKGNAHEPYTGTYIFERDGWICGICGQKINKRLKYPNPRSKSIDHIVPISKGGVDAPINVQAAHLRCNMSKHAGSGGQLRLIG